MGMNTVLLEGAPSATGTLMRGLTQKAQRGSQKSFHAAATGQLQRMWAHVGGRGREGTRKTVVKD